MSRVYYNQASECSRKGSELEWSFISITERAQVVWSPYNKLIRDHIEEKIKNKGSHCEVRTLVDNDEFTQELLKKVREEAGGLAMARSREEFLAEYVDLMVVLDALTHQFEISEADIKVAMTENIAKKGLYKNRHFLHW